MPRFASRGRSVAGLYRWLGEQLEARYSRPDPRLPAGAPLGHVPDALARFRAGLPVTVPAWRLDGHDATAAGFVGVVPAAREFRRAAYVVGPDDVVRPADSEV